MMAILLRESCREGGRIGLVLTFEWRKHVGISTIPFVDITDATIWT